MVPPGPPCGKPWWPETRFLGYIRSTLEVHFFDFILGVIKGKKLFFIGDFFWEKSRGKNLASGLGLGAPKNAKKRKIRVF